MLGWKLTGAKLEKTVPTYKLSGVDSVWKLVPRAAKRSGESRTWTPKAGELENTLRLNTGNKA